MFKSLLNLSVCLSTILAVELAPPAVATGSYSVGGFDDAAAFERFYEELQKDVARGDKSATAALFSYPMSIRFPPQKRLVKIASKAQFIKNYDRIFNSQAKKAIKETKTADLFCNYQGVMVGNGQLWFAPGESGGVQIKTVNATN